MIKEPFVKVNTIDYTNLGGNDLNDLVLGMVVNSDCGPTEITRVENQSDFVNKYMTNNQLVDTDDTTVIHAMKMLEFTPIYLTRAFDNSVYGGLTNNNEVIYVDKNFNVMTNYKNIEFKNPATGFNAVFMVFTHDGQSYMYYAGSLDSSSEEVNSLLSTYPNYYKLDVDAKFESLIDYLNNYISVQGLDSILAIENKDGKNYITIPATSSLVDAGYVRGTGSKAKVTKLAIANTYASNQYTEFTFNVDDSQFATGQYFSINGFTYYPHIENNTSIYPYIGTPIRFYNSENNTAKLLAYLTDLQYSGNRNIKPSLLYMDSKVTLNFAEEATNPIVKITNLKINYTETSPGTFVFRPTSGSTEVHDASIVITYIKNGESYAICLYNGTMPIITDPTTGKRIELDHINFGGSINSNGTVNNLTDDYDDLHCDAKFLVRLSELGQNYYTLGEADQGKVPLVPTSDTNYKYRLTSNSSEYLDVPTTYNLPNNSLIKFTVTGSESVTNYYQKIVSCYPLADAGDIVSNTLRLTDSEIDQYKGEGVVGYTSSGDRLAYLTNNLFTLSSGDYLFDTAAEDIVGTPGTGDNPNTIVIDDETYNYTIGSDQYSITLTKGTLIITNSNNKVIIDDIVYSFKVTGDILTLTPWQWYVVNADKSLTRTDDKVSSGNIRYYLDLPQTESLDSFEVYPSEVILDGAVYSVTYITEGTDTHLPTNKSFYVDGNNDSDYTYSLGSFTDFEVAKSELDSLVGSMSITLNQGDIVLVGTSDVVGVLDSTGRAKLIYPVGYYSSSDISKITKAPVNALGPMPPDQISIFSMSDDESILGDITYSGVNVLIGDDDTKYLFYNGEYTTDDADVTPVRVSSKELTFVQIVKKFRKYIGDYFKSINSPNGLMLMSDDPDAFSTFNVTGPVDVKTYDVNNEGILDSAKLAVVSISPSKIKNLRFTLTQDTDDPEIWDFKLSHTNGEEQDYSISFNPNKIDGYGVNIYYSNVNEMSEYIHLIELNGSDIKNISSPLFGTEVPIAEPESDDYVSAVRRFADDSNIYYDFIFDGGYANTSYSKAIFEVCKQIYAEGVLTPIDTANYRVLKKYRSDLGIDSDEGWRCVLRGNLIKDSTVGDFLTYISPGAIWIEKIYNNKESGKEFAPVFGAYNSTVSYNAKVWFNNKSIREELLSVEIPVLINDKSLNRNYFNLDTTLRAKDSYLSSANNCRMINASAHICDNALKMYIGRFNDDITRTEVVNDLTRRLEERLINNQQYAPHAIRVVCDETNNTPAILKARQLVVDVWFQFEAEIRYVHVYQKIIDIDKDINTAI